LRLATALALTSPAVSSGQEPDGWALHIDYVQSLIEAEPSVPLHYVRLAQAYAQVGDEDQVLRNIDEAVKRGGSRLAADILAGDFYAKQGRDAKAIHHYLAVLSESPSQPHVLTQVWKIVQKSKAKTRLGVDRAVLSDVLNAQGFHVAPLRGRTSKARCQKELKRGNELLAAGDLVGATRAYEEAAHHDPWNPRVHRSLGIAYAREGRLNEATGAYTLYTALAPAGTEDVAKVQRIIFDFYRARTSATAPRTRTREADF
jgi:Tfp pilus assembly protein PilF